MRHIGVHLGKKAFTACFLEQDEQHQLLRLPMTREGLASFCGQLHADDRLAVEACPNAYFFYDQVRPALAEVALVSPRQFAVIATSTKKTDREDARTLARFLKLGWSATELAGVAAPLPSPRAAAAWRAWRDCRRAIAWGPSATSSWRR